MNYFTKLNSAYNSTYVDMADENELYEIKDRKIIPPENPTKIFQTESNSQIITFTTNRYQEGVDLATKRINIVCKNAMHKKYTFPAVNVYVNDTDLRFSWLIKRDVSIYHGIVIFKVEFLGDTNDIYDSTTTENDDTDYSLITGNCTLEVLRSVNFSNASTSEQNYWYTDLLQQVDANTQEVTGHLIERLDKFTENFGEIGGNQYCRKFTNVFYKDVKGLTLDEIMDLSSESVYLKIKLPNTYNAGKKIIIDFSVSTYMFSSQYQVVLDLNSTKSPKFKSYVGNNDVFSLKIASDDDGYYIILDKDVISNSDDRPASVNTFFYRCMTIAVNSVVVAPPSFSNVGGVYEIVEDCDYINGFDASYTYDISDLTVLYEHEVNKGLNSEKINGNRITSSNSVPSTKEKDDIWVTDDSIQKYDGENWVDVIKTTRSYDDLTDAPSSLPNPESISINGQSYDGSEQVDIGIQGITYGGTGATTARQARENLGAASEKSIASFLLPNTYNNENVYLVNKSSCCYESYHSADDINALYAIYITRGLTFIDPSGNIISPNEDIYLKSDDEKVKIQTGEYYYCVLYRYGEGNNSQYLYIDHTGEMMYLSLESMGKELYLALFYNNDKGWYFGLCNEKTKENATLLIHDLTGLKESKNLIDLKPVDFTGKMFEEKTIYVQKNPPSSPKTHYLWIW